MSSLKIVYDIYKLISTCAFILKYNVASLTFSLISELPELYASVMLA